MMARAGRQLAIAHGAQFPAEGLLGDGDADSSKIHCARSTSRQRTTPWTAEIGPLSIIAKAWRWASLSLEGWPGDLP